MVAQRPQEPRSREPTLSLRLLLLIAATTLLVSVTMTWVVGRLAASAALEVGASNLRSGLERKLPEIAAAERPEEIAALVDQTWGGFDGLRWVLGPAADGATPEDVALLRQAADLLATEELADYGSADGGLAHRVDVRQRRVVVAARLAGGNLFVLDYHPTIDAERLWPVPLGALASALVSALLFALFLTRPMRRRVAALREALGRYGEGEKDVRLPLTEPHHELSQIHEAFNAMADRIAQLEATEHDRRRRHEALLAGLAHDINTPLTVIRGNAEILLDHGDLDGGQHRVVSDLVTQSLYVQALVDDLLILAREQGDRVPLSCREVHLDDLIDGLVDTFEPAASRRGLALFGDGRGLTVHADPTRLRQMLTNLIRNALLHAADATSLEISARNDGESVVLRVEDDGPGIPAAEVPRLFREFRRGEGSGGAGFGLGLATVALLADLHGGSARHVEGTDGACFEIVVPDSDRAGNRSEEAS